VGNDSICGSAALPGGLSGPVHIHHDPLPSRPVEQAAGRRKRFASKQILLKARAQGFHGGLIKGRKKTGKRRAMGQLVSIKQGHERLGKRSEPFVKGKQGGFARNCIADQHGDKIDEIVVRHPRARAKRTCSWIVFRIPVWVSRCAKAVSSPIQEGIEGSDVVIWMVTGASVMTLLGILRF